MTDNARNDVTKAAAQDAEAARRAQAGGGYEIAIDAGAGISEEEQRQILTQINGIAEKNRESLSSGTAGGREGFRAKKSGGLFPVLVNAAAAIVLIGGFLLLAAFQSGADVQAREGTRVFNDAERALIEEIRRETGGLLAETDREIAQLLSMLAEVEAQLQGLIAGGAAQAQAYDHEQLVARRAELSVSLATARDERSRILGDARSREALLQAQLDARAREPADGAYRPDPELGAARAELARLAEEQTRAAQVESQVAASFAGIHRQIAEYRFDDAAQSIGELREFLDAPAFREIQAIQARRELYVQATGAIEALLGERAAAQARPPAAGLLPELGGDAALLHGEIERLQGDLARANETIELAAGGATQIVSQLQGTIDSLQTERANLSSQLGSLQGDLGAARADANNLRQNVLPALEREHAQTVSSLEDQVRRTREASERALEPLEQAIQGMPAAVQPLLLPVRQALDSARRAIQGS